LVSCISSTTSPDVKALVYLAALAPDRGEVLGELVETPVAHPSAPMPLIPVNVTQPDGTQRTDLYLDPSEFRDRFAADVPPRVADDLAATQRPLSKAAFTSALTVEPAWKTIPSWYLVSKQDKVMSPDLERLQAHRMHAHTSQIDSSHAVYISHPEAVADLTEQAARATR
jgi:pimeloyl-ACP methyl ester carboxylesterase